MCAWFDEDWKWLDDLDWLRWPDGFRRLNALLSKAGEHRTDGGGVPAVIVGCRPTAGTIFHGTPYALDRVVLRGLAPDHQQGRDLRHSATARDGTRLLPDRLGDVAPLPHRDGAPGRERRTGDVEVDESFLGGPAPGVPGRGALGKVLFAGAVELDERGFGRARLGVLENANATSMRTFLVDNVEPGSKIITDGWSAYPPATRDLYTHKGTSVTASGLDAHEVLPAVHRVFSLVKRWVMGTMGGSVSPEHVQAYFDE